MIDVIWATPLYEFLRQRNASPLEKTIRFFMTKPDIAQAMGEIKRVLKHGDFGTSNILFDRQQRTICGVIDFGSSGLGDPAYDLAGLLSCYGEAFVRRCWQVYPEIESFMDRVRFYQGSFALEETLFGIENTDQAAAC